MDDIRTLIADCVASASRTALAPEEQAARLREDDRRARQHAAEASRCLDVIPTQYRPIVDESGSLVHRDRIRRPEAVEDTVGAVGEDWIVWQGAPGSGKTTLASWALLARIRLESHRADHGKKPLRPAYVAAWNLARSRLGHSLGDGEPELVRTCLRAGILLLDDLGDDDRSSASAVHDVIFHRHEQSLPTLITTAFDTASLSDRYGAGIARRVFERATVIRCDE